MKKVCCFFFFLICDAEMPVKLTCWRWAEASEKKRTIEIRYQSEKEEKQADCSRLFAANFVRSQKVKLNDLSAVSVIESWQKKKH